MWEPTLITRILTIPLPDDDSCVVCGNRKQGTSGKKSWHCKRQTKHGKGKRMYSINPFSQPTGGEGRQPRALQMSLSVKVRYFGGWNPLDGKNKVTSHACSPLNNS